MPRPRSTTTILLIEDDERDRKMILEPLREKYTVEVAIDYTQAKEKIDKCNFDVVFLDLMLPNKQSGKIDESGKLGLDLLRIVREKEPLTPIVVISGLASVKTAMEVLQEGIVDFIVKDDIEDQLPLIMKRAELIRQGRIEHLILRRESRVPEGTRFVYSSPAMQKVIDQVDDIARKDPSVLILGETGVGKELIAREIHARSPRSGGPFIEVNCGAIVQGLLESELFGHEKGAFTGADRQKAGLFELAHNGTLLLDEITEMSLDLQVKFLRVLQERNFRRVGGEKTLSVNVRVIAATNKNIEAEVKAKRFRDDLFYRIAVMQVAIPPLREHTEDIETLIAYFIEKCKPGSGLSFSPKLLRMMKGYGWPGNVRELENVVQRILSAYKGSGELIYPRDVPSHIPVPPEKSLPFDKGMFDLACIERQVIERAVQHFGTQKEAVHRLGISDSKLRRKIKEFGITYKRVRKTKGPKNEKKLTGIEKQQRLILAYMEDHDSFTTRDIVNMLGGVANKTAIARLNELIEAGKVRRLTRGRYERNRSVTIKVQS